MSNYLTEAQKKKIEEEERYRAQLRSETATGKNNKKGHGCLTIAFVIFFVIPVILYGLRTALLGETNKSNPSPTVAPKEDLVGNVNFDGSQFHITNQEDKDWINCWMKVNNDYIYPHNAPLSKLDAIKAGETISFTPGEFTLNDGTRFNAYTTAPTNFSLDCDGRFGYWSWN